jgi:hypothetical protein
MKQTLEVKNRGYGFLVPIGKVLTQHEEKNDVRTLVAGGILDLWAHSLTWTYASRKQADDGSEVDESARSSRPESPTDEGEGDGDGNGEGEGEGEEDGGMDLDDELEDMDDDFANTTGETDDVEDMDELEAGELEE